MTALDRTALGIELGSTRIKACLVNVDDPTRVLAAGSHEWENDCVDGVWTYSIEDVWSGLQQAYADLVSDAKSRWGEAPSRIAAIGVSAMMHGYLPLDSSGEPLVPFRTWRNTNTVEASEELGLLFGLKIPLRWSIAHLHQAIRDGEEHVPQIASITTLAGYVHVKLTGRRVLGVGDASGMFPIDTNSRAYDSDLVSRYDRLTSSIGFNKPLLDLLPEVLFAGEDAGRLTESGAALLDRSGSLMAGLPFCPPEGDAGTGMVATDAIAPRTGNVSAGTSIFAMVVLEKSISAHHEVDVVTTPVGDPVAMVHCNNGASELGAWVGLFQQFAEVSHTPMDADAVFDRLFRVALDGASDAGGLLAYNHLSGEPIAGLIEGRPLLVRTPGSRLNLANLMRAQLYGVFSTLALGMGILTGEGVKLDRMAAHGGMFRTAGVPQRFLAAALNVPVTVSETASEGGAWGMAILAAYAASHSQLSLVDFLSNRVFSGVDSRPMSPDPDDVAGFAAYLTSYRNGLAIERAAVESL